MSSNRPLVPPARDPRKGEAGFFATRLKNFFLSVVERPDGKFQVYQDTLQYDEEESVLYWTETLHPLGGIYPSRDEALSEFQPSYGPFREVDGVRPVGPQGQRDA